MIIVGYCVNTQVESRVSANQHKIYDWEMIDNYLERNLLGVRWMADFARLGLDNDALSKQQMVSKYELAQELKKYAPKNIAIVGAWYGQLAQILHQSQVGNYYTGIDIDPCCQKPAEILNTNIDYYHITQDMFNTDYFLYDCIINTSCEHIRDPGEWLSLIPNDTRVVLQSNNYHEARGHISCVNSIAEFKHLCGNTIQIEETVTIEMPLYTRFMIIGMTK